MKVYLNVAGDSNVGIPDYEFTVDLGFDVHEDDDRRHIAETLEKCFKEIYDTPVGVAFEDELVNYQSLLKQEEGIWGEDYNAIYG